MTNQEYRYRPHNRTHRIRRKLLEVIRHKGRVTMQFAHDAGIDILQTPARNHRIIARNQETGKHLKIAYPLPGSTIREFGIGTCGIRCTMTTDDKLRNHTWNAQQEYTSDVYQNKGCATFLSSHIREAPYVTQTYGATCCSKNQSNLATKTSSI